MHLQEEAARCLLCVDAPCGKVCKNGDLARAIRAIRFGNESVARQWVENCSDEEFEAAERACIHYDRPIRICEMLKQLPEVKKRQLPDLAIDFCGLHCENPFFLASSAICTNYEMVERAFNAGWAGVFYKTICMQDISFGEDRQPHIIGTKCVGCHLCRLVCPTGAIGAGKRIKKNR